MLIKVAELLIETLLEFATTKHWTHIVDKGLYGGKWQVTVHKLDDLAYVVQEETMLGVPV